MKRIGRYEIRGLLGKGGMGVVYKAAMPVTGRIVALKVCRPAEMLAAVAGLEAVRRDFFREAKAMADIRHPNVARIWDVDEAGGEAFFVMEYYCDNLGVAMGESFVVERPTRRLSVDVSLRYASQLLSALARLHFAGMVHRDVKPYNLMLTDEDDVKLIDFGLSRLRGEVHKGPRGSVVGSPYYAAPEQEADPDSADERADLFSVGVTLYRMLTGELPQEAAKKVKSIVDLNPDLDSDWDDFFRIALHDRQNGRFQSAREMLAAVDGLRIGFARRKAQVCALIEEPEPPAPGATPPLALRSRPARVPLKSGRAAFGLDALWRPQHYARNDFQDFGDGTALDRASGLVWEISGSPYPLTLEEAGAYLASLNERRFGGRTGWRLPTVPELCSLLRERARPGEFCLTPVCDPSKRRLWSADRKSFIAAWYADAEMGFVWWQDATCSFYVRAVAGS